MGKFSELDLHWWEKDELEDLEEEYKISEMSISDLHKLASALFWEAEGLHNSANSLESKADTIHAYLRTIDT